MSTINARTRVVITEHVFEKGTGIIYGIEHDLIATTLTDDFNPGEALIAALTNFIMPFNRRKHAGGRCEDYHCIDKNYQTFNIFP